MCDCDELEFEDFQVMMKAISKLSTVPAAEAPEAPMIKVSAPRKK